MGGRKYYVSAEAEGPPPPISWILSSTAFQLSDDLILPLSSDDVLTKQRIFQEFFVILVILLVVPLYWDRGAFSHGWSLIQPDGGRLEDSGQGRL
jgi:hypothetical protein